MQSYTEEQLLHHLAGLGQWTRIRAQELRHFTEQLPSLLKEAGEDPARAASLHYALRTYITGVQDMVDRCREAQQELERRTAAKV
jgi:hypothetical protein